MRNLLKWCALIVLIGAVSGFAAWAQSTGGGLQGRITDEAGEPVIGATIQVTGPSLQGFQGAATDSEGLYRIPFLPVGSGYSVKVEAPGYNTMIRKGFDVSLGTTISLNFELSQGTDVLDVIGSAPVVDTRTTETGAIISDQIINSIPLGRDSANIAYLAPSAVPNMRGVADMGPAIGGASGPENVYIVNGVDVTGSGDALNLTTLNFDFIEATEVKTGGMDAEWGAATGGAINSVTKSGSNEFHGGMFLYYWSDDLGASERSLKSHTVTNQIEGQKIWDLGGFIGGYFIKDKLWFFLAYDYNKEEQNWTAEGTDANVTLNGQPSYSWARTSGYKNDIKNPQYAFKMTWNISPNHRAVFSFFGDQDKRTRYRSLNNPSPIASATADDRKNWALSAQWNATWTPNFFTEALIARRSTKDTTYPTNQAAMDNWGYYYRYGSGTYAGYQVIPTGPYNSYDTSTRAIDLGSYLPSLGGRTFLDVKDVSDQLRLKFTNLFNAAGRHELVYGMQYYDINYDQDFNYTGPGFTELYAGNHFAGQTTQGGAVIRWQPSGSSSSGYLFRAQGFMNSQYKQTTQKYTAFHIQDNWNITDYFMLKLGVRYDKIDMKGGDDVVAPGRKMKIDSQWAYRLGFTWDIAHNGKSKLYGFLGRYYERVPQDMAIRALSTEYFHFSYFEDYNLSIPVDHPGYHYTYGLDPTIITGGPGGGGIKGAYNDEAIVGFQYEIAPDFSVGARAIYRSLGRAIEDISVDGANQYIVTNPGAWTDVWVPDVFGRVDGNGDPYRYKFPRPVRIYSALEITADKRFSNNWQLAGSYVMSRLKGNYEGLFSNDNGQLDPNITSKYDIPSLLINSYGLLPNDRTHNLKLYGGYHWDFGLDLSARFQLMSGNPISALGADDAYGTNEGFSHRRGTAGRTPTIWFIDVGIQYNWKLGFSTLGFRADIFNLTNEQRTTRVDQTFNNVDTSPGQTYPYFKEELAHQRARRMRLALRWTF